MRPSAEWLQAHHRASKPGQHNARPVAPLGGTPSYGCNIISSSSCDYVSFDADAPGTLNSIATENELMFGASFVADDFTKEYVVGYPSGDLETIDTATGVRTTVGPTGQGTATRDLAYDIQTGTLFGTAIDGSGTDLFTVDTTTGNMTLVAPISGLGPQAYVMGLAVDPNTGLMYGIEIVTSSLIAIDKTTGAATTIGSLGYQTRFGQGLDFNAATGVLYLASIDYGAGGSQNMYTVNLTTGQASLIAPIGNNIIQLGAFGIAVPSGPCGQPSDLPWLSLNPTSGTTAPGSDTPVTVTIDATGSVDGDVLSGTVCVRSNDPDEHTVEVPVEYTVGTGGGGTIVDSGPVNITINQDFTGLYINWLTGATCTSADPSCTPDDYNWNPWASSGNMNFVWEAATDACVVTGPSCSILASGATIGSGSTFGAGDAILFRAGSTGYIGFKFDNAGTTNYGYAKLTTTSPSGFPATVNEYWYDNSGASISIP